MVGTLVLHLPNNHLILEAFQNLFLGLGFTEVGKLGFLVFGPSSDVLGFGPNRWLDRVLAQILLVAWDDILVIFPNFSLRVLNQHFLPNFFPLGVLVLLQFRLFLRFHLDFPHLFGQELTGYRVWPDPVDGGGVGVSVLQKVEQIVNRRLPISWRHLVL